MGLADASSGQDFLETDHFWLRPVWPRDTEPLFVLSNNHPEFWLRLASRGSNSPQEFSDRLWQDVASQHLLCRRQNGVPVCLATISRLDLLSRTCNVDVVALEDGGEVPAAVDCARTLVIDEAMLAWDMRKVYLEFLDAPGLDFGRAAEGVEEARFERDHRHHGGYVDRVIVAVWRDDWLAARSSSLARIGARPA
jgi:hypothetical protein